MLALRISLTSIVHSCSSLNSCHGSGWKWARTHSVISFSVAYAYVLTILVSKNLMFPKRTRISRYSNLFRPLEGAVADSTFRFAAMKARSMVEMLTVESRNLAFVAKSQKSREPMFGQDEVAPK